MTLSERAEKTRALLFERYDQLNQLWNEAEKELTSGHIPRPVSFQFRFDDDFDGFQPTGNGYAHCLGLQKIKGKWRICYGSYYSPHQAEEGPSWMPIIECSGEDRIAAAPHLSKFREKIVEDAESFVSSADKAIATLRAALEGTKNEELAALRATRAKLNGKTR